MTPTIEPERVEASQQTLDRHCEGPTHPTYEYGHSDENDILWSVYISCGCGEWILDECDGWVQNTLRHRKYNQTYDIDRDYTCIECHGAAHVVILGRVN